mgnify:CR=1 FL=1
MEIMDLNISNLFDGVYKNKKVFLTGDTGFKGSWLALWLNAMGADVYGFSLPPRSMKDNFISCLLYTSPSPRDRTRSRMPSSA